MAKTLWSFGHSECNRVKLRMEWIGMEILCIQRSSGYDRFRELEPLNGTLAGKNFFHQNEHYSVLRLAKDYIHQNFAFRIPGR